MKRTVGSIGACVDELCDEAHDNKVFLAKAIRYEPTQFRQFDATTRTLLGQ